MNKPFAVGQRVAWINPFSKRPECTGIVEVADPTIKRIPSEMDFGGMLVPDGLLIIRWDDGVLCACGLDSEDARRRIEILTP